MTSPRKEHPLTGQRTQTAWQEASAGHRARLGSGGAAGSGERAARALRGSGGGPALGCGGPECPRLLRVVKGYLFSAFRDVSISPQGRASDHLVLLSLSVLHPKKIPNPI